MSKSNRKKTAVALAVVAVVCVVAILVLLIPSVLNDVFSTFSTNPALDQFSAFSLDDEHIAYLYKGNRNRTYYLIEGTHIGNHQGKPEKQVFSADGNTMMVVSDSGDLYLVSAQSVIQIADNVSMAILSADGGTFAYCQDGGLYRQDTLNGYAEMLAKDLFPSFAMSPGGSVIAWAEQAETGSCEVFLQEGGNIAHVATGFLPVAVSDDGQYLYGFLAEDDSDTLYLLTDGTYHELGETNSIQFNRDMSQVILYADQKTSVFFEGSLAYTMDDHVMGTQTVVETDSSSHPLYGDSTVRCTYYCVDSFESQIIQTSNYFYVIPQYTSYEEIELLPVSKVFVSYWNDGILYHDYEALWFSTTEQLLADKSKRLLENVERVSANWDAGAIACSSGDYRYISYDGGDTWNLVSSYEYPYYFELDSDGRLYYLQDGDLYYVSQDSTEAQVAKGNKDELTGFFIHGNTIYAYHSDRIGYRDKVYTASLDNMRFSTFRTWLR